MQDYVGIDMGTSSVKLLIMDSGGRILRQHEERYAVSCPQKGWREADPRLWFEKTMTGLRVLLKGTDKKSIRAIGITGQMHSTVFLDKDGKIIRPAILWNDTRTSKEVWMLKEKIAENRQIACISDIISTGSPAANLYWLRRHEAEQFQCMEHFLIGPDYLVFRLTGEYGTDYCEASTSSLFDLKQRIWSEDMRRILGLSPQIFPAIMGSTCAAGNLIPEIAEETGLSSETLVVRGTGDNAAAAFAASPFWGGKPVISLGTSGVLILEQEEPDILRKGKKILFSEDGRRFKWLVQGAVQSSGSSVEWWEKKILDAKSVESPDRAKERMHENELLFYPHLNGEKTLYGDAALRGAFVGIGMDTTRADMSIAVLEGICFAFRELYEKMGGRRPEGLQIGVVGGGAKNTFWMQMMADVLHAAIVRLKGTTGAVYGAAMLAAKGAGDTGSFRKEQERKEKEREIFYPRPDKSRYYDEKYKKYLRAYQALSYINAGENGCRAV